MILNVSGTPLPYDNLDDLRNRIEDIAPHLVRFGKLESPTFGSLTEQLAAVNFLF